MCNQGGDNEKRFTKASICRSTRETTKRDREGRQGGREGGREGREKAGEGGASTREQQSERVSIQTVKPQPITQSGAYREEDTVLNL